MQNQPIRPKRILIVDDETTLVFFLKQGLQEAKFPCQIEIAASGEDALTKLTYNPYDLLITDLKMPGITGFTLVEVARSLHPQIKVILMTAFGSKEVQTEAKNLQVQGYLTKPFSTARLRELIGELLVAEADDPLEEITASQSSPLNQQAKNNSQQ